MLARIVSAALSAGGALLAAIVVAALLVACGGGAQSIQTDSYTVTLRLEGAGVGERTATIDIADRQGRPAAPDAVVLAPVMRDMGMASPEVTAQPSGPGRYTARAPFFSMLGEWELDVRVTAGGADETASFTVQVQ